MSDYPDQTRNMNPHKEARAAMWLFGTRYGAQNGGSMDFWDSISEKDKNICRSLVTAIGKAKRRETAQERAEASA